jgi:hypothetical protein
MFMRIPGLFFRRDHRGREMDLIEERAHGIEATEILAFNFGDFLKGR